MKKFFLAATLVILFFTVAACQRTIRVDLIVDGERYDRKTLNKPGEISLPRPESEGHFFAGWYKDDDFEERFDGLVHESMSIHAKFVPFDGELSTYLTDRYEIPDYLGNNFFTDGIGTVDLVACRDGDTADFQDGDKQFRVRFLGIDTPESGHVYEPWGPAASAHACEAMQNAETIVLERDSAAGNRGTYGRELAYVWVDGRLLNLELIELAYTYASGVDRLKHGFEMRMAEDKAALSGRRLYSEDDPDHDYSDAVDTTIADIVQNHEDYMTKRVNIEGVSIARIGQHAFLEDPDGDYGIFFYIGYETEPRLAVGYQVRIENAQVYHNGKPFGGLFLTDYGSATITIEDEDVAPTIHTTSFDELDFFQTGLRFTYENVTVTDIDEEGFHFTIENEAGESMRVHQLFEAPLLNDTQHSLMPAAHRLDLDTLTKGQTLDLTVNLSEIDGELVFVLAHRDDVTIID